MANFFDRFDSAAPQEPRGIRNNNPGNIEDGGFARSQPGYAGGDGRFARFNSADDGLAAMDGLLQSYAKRGINTPAGIIGRWAPSADGNPVMAYADHVARGAGVGPNDALDMNNPETRRTVALAMAEFENGKKVQPSAPKNNYFDQFDGAQAQEPPKVDVQIRPTGSKTPFADRFQGETQAKPDMGVLPSIGEGVRQGATFNFGDELVGASAAGMAGVEMPADQRISMIGKALSVPVGVARMLYEKMQGEVGPATKAYALESERVKQQGETAQEQHPGAFMAGNIGGAVALPVGVGAGGATALARVGRGLATGAAMGGLAGAGEGGSMEERASMAASGAAMGGALGSVAGPVLGRIADRAAQKEVRAAIPSIEDLKTAASRDYNSPAVKGLEINGQAVSQWSAGVQHALSQEGLDPAIAPKTFAVLSRLESSPSGASVTGSSMNNMHKVFGKIAKDLDGNERYAASLAQRSIGDFLDNMDASKVVRGDAAEAQAALKRARGNFSAASRASEVDKKLIRAELRAAAANSGMNVANTIRQRMVDIMANPAAKRGFSEAEQAAMERIIRGTKTSNTMRAAGNALGGGGGIGSAVTALGGGSVVGPAGFLTPVIGAGLKMLGNRMTVNDAERLGELIRSRSPEAEAIRKSMESWQKSVGRVQSSPTNAAGAALTLSSRNLSNNLAKAGIVIAPADIIRALQGPIEGRADAENQQPPGERNK